MQKISLKSLLTLAFFKVQHNNWGHWIKSYVRTQSPNGFAGRCFLGLGCQSSINPLTCTTFDPRFLLLKARNFKAYLRISYICSQRGNVWASLMKRYYDATLLVKRRHRATQPLTHCSRSDDFMQDYYPAHELQKLG